jgi:nucleoside-diphosphate-sugar epimerase
MTSLKKKIFITGGGGYVGSRLVPILLKKKYHVTVYDIFYFGNKLIKNKNLKIIKGDIRNYKKIKKFCKKHDYFLHLACISNDSSFELDKKLSKLINYDAFEPIVLAAKANSIKRFIYASSSSVYGVSNKKNVKEDHPLVPLTLYNKYKGMCEPLLFKHTDKNFEGVIFRPATVCGYSPRMRLDLTVNILTNFAYNKNYIRVLGGNQLRPNLHILDYCDAVLSLIKAPKEKIQNQIFNVGNENMSILKIADKVKKIVSKKRSTNNIQIIKDISNDKRSYHINSGKIFKTLKFKPKRNIEEAIKELCMKFKQKKIKNSFTNLNYFNVKKLLKLKVK